MSLFDRLGEIRIKPPNPSSTEETQGISIQDALQNGGLRDRFYKQYHTDGVLVEFIPRYIRPIVDNPYFFYEEGCGPSNRDAPGKSQKFVKTDGFRHEVLVQDMFENLSKGEKFTDSLITIFHNIKSDFLRFNKLKSHLKNEIDLLMFDRRYGVFVLETKKRKFETLTGKSLDTQLKKQRSRKEFLKEMSRFLELDHIPITCVILTSVEQDSEIRISQQDTDSYVVGMVYDKDSFGSDWYTFLNQLPKPKIESRFDKNNMEELLMEGVEKFVVTFDALLHCGDTPSQLHFNLTGGSALSPGKYQTTKSSNILIWTKQQREILDFIEDTFEKYKSDNQTYLRLVINGCYGSGKTLILFEAAKLFCELYDSGDVLYFLDTDRHNWFNDHDTLLEEQFLASSNTPGGSNRDRFHADGLRINTYETMNAINIDDILSQFKMFSEFPDTNINEPRCCEANLYTLYYKRCDNVRLLLFDEYKKDRYPSFICEKDHGPFHVIVTCHNNYKSKSNVGFEGFKFLNLKENVRSNVNILRYLNNREFDKLNTIKDKEDFIINNQSRGRSRIEEMCLDELEVPKAVEHIVDKIKDILELDKNEEIYLISDLSSMVWQFVSGAFEERDFTIKLEEQVKDLKNVTVGNINYFIGCEASTVVYVTYNMKMSMTQKIEDALSRATVNLIIFYFTDLQSKRKEMPWEWSEEISNEMDDINEAREAEYRAAGMYDSTDDWGDPYEMYRYDDGPARAGINELEARLADQWDWDVMNDLEAFIEMYRSSPDDYIT